MSSTPRTSKGSATRVRVLTQARQLLVERGYGNLAMREVAAACDMQLGNLQYYFPNHDALVIGIIEAEAQSDVGAVAEIVNKQQEPKKKLRSVVSELVTRWRGESGVVFSTLNLMVLHNEAYRTIYNETREIYYRALEDIIEEISPGQTPGEYATRARLLCALIDGVPYQTNIGRKEHFLSRVQQLAYGIANGSNTEQ